MREKKRRVRENCGKKSDGNHKGKLAKSIRDFRDLFSHIIPACPSKSKLRPQKTTKSDPWGGCSDALLQYIWPSVEHTFHAHSTHRGYPLGTVLNQGFLAGVALAFGDLGPPIALLHVAWNEWCPIVELGRPHRCGVGKSASREGDCQHGNSIDRSGEL